MKYIYYNQYLINRDLQNFNILVSKIKGGYLTDLKLLIILRRIFL